MSGQLMRSFLVALLISFTLVIVPHSASASPPKNERESTKWTALHNAMRKLWQDQRNSNSGRNHKRVFLHRTQ
jgi:hypothetical protein